MKIFATMTRSMLISKNKKEIRQYTNDISVI